MAYDSKLGDLVMVQETPLPSGRAAPTLTTWLFNGHTWAKMRLAVEPPMPSYAQITYDAKLGDVVMVVEDAPVSPSSIAGTLQTWLFDGKGWAQVKTATSIPEKAIYNFYLTYDAALSMPVMVDVDDSSQSYHMWLFNGQTWLPGARFPESQDAPELTNLLAMTYDPLAGGILLLAGVYYSIIADTFLFQDRTLAWRNLHTSDSVPISSAGVSNIEAVFDERLGCVVALDFTPLAIITSGNPGNGGKFKFKVPPEPPYTLCGNGRSWVQLHPAANPPLLVGELMAYDPRLGDVVVSGGAVMLPEYGRISSNDTWLFNGHTWTKVVY
jgi:hypothetical protein